MLGHCMLGVCIKVIFLRIWHLIVVFSQCLGQFVCEPLIAFSEKDFVRVTGNTWDSFNRLS